MDRYVWFIEGETKKIRKLVEGCRYGNMVEI